jgi:hypothetical protein
MGLPRAAEKPAQAVQHRAISVLISRMKGHEDDGMFFENGRSSSIREGWRFLPDP